jgi:hypothetical protein
MSKKMILKADAKGFPSVEVSIAYELGGYNYFSGGTNKRGYYMYVHPIQINDRGDYKSFTIPMFEGTKILLKEVTRFSQKVMDSFDFDFNLIEQMCKHCGYILEKDGNDYVKI